MSRFATITTPGELSKARSALANAQRRRLTDMMRELAEIDGSRLIEAAGYLQHYDRDRLAVILTLAADVT